MGEEGHGSNLTFLGQRLYSRDWTKALALSRLIHIIPEQVDYCSHFIDEVTEAQKLRYIVLHPRVSKWWKDSFLDPEAQPLSLKSTEYYLKIIPPALGSDLALKNHLCA